MKRELNDRYLKSLSPPETGRLEVSDTKRVGLRFRLSASGRATWMFEKRVKGGAKRKHTLGAWPEPVSLAAAREMALAIEAEAAQGFDRVLDARAKKLAAEEARSKQKSIREVLDLYDSLHLSSLRRGTERRRQLDQALAKALDEPIGSLTKGMLQEAIDEKITAGRKVYANRIRAALMAFTRWAWERNHLPANIGESLPKGTKEEERTRAPNLDEVRLIWNATFDMGPTWGPFLRLLLLTAQRRSEILGLVWSEVDLDNTCITKPGSQTKNGKEHVTHLSGPAIVEMKALYEAKSVGARKPSGLVFTTTGHSPLSGVSKAKARLDAFLNDNVEPWRLHDLRTSFATSMAESGIPESVADRVLNHSAIGSAPSAVARVYNKADMLTQRAAALDFWAKLVTHVSDRSGDGGKQSGDLGILETNDGRH